MDEEIVNLSFGSAKIFDHFIEININEGITFRTEDLETLFDLFDTYFPKKEFGYLSNRAKDYSLELTPGLYKSFHENLKATAVVCYSNSSFQNAKFEKEFYKNVPCEVFREYEEAVNWLKTYF